MNEWDEEVSEAIEQALLDSITLLEYFGRNNYTQREASLTCAYLMVSIMRSAGKNLDDCYLMTKSFWDLLEELKK
jgi:hypothetical protein